MPTDRDLFDEEQEMVAMSFGDHIEELRLRLILALLGLAVGVVGVLVPIPGLPNTPNIGKLVMDGMQQPAQTALEEFYTGRAEERAKVAEAAKKYATMQTRIAAADFAKAMKALYPSLPEPSSSTLSGKYVDLPLELKESELINEVNRNVEKRSALISLGPLETVIIYFTVCLIAGLVLSSPWVFYQLWAFVAAGLYRHERSYVYKFLPFSLGLFLAGVFLCYFGVLPFTLKFLLQFNLWLGIEPNFRLSEWMGFATILPLVFGLGFQTPLVMLFLAKLGIFTANDYRAKRKIAILLTVVAAAVLTPGPDVFSQVMLAVPMILLYELGIILVDRQAAQLEAAGT